MRRTILVILLSFSLTGCFLAPFIESFKSAGATKSDREALLPREVKRFTDALFWGSPGPVMELVDPEAQRVVQQQVSDATDKEKVVESRVSSTDFDQDSWNAAVQVKVKYYRIPYYVVQERIEKQNWRFSMADGWRLTSRQIN